MEAEKTYEILSPQGETGIKCLLCGQTSFHPQDVKQKYCDNCHQFHDLVQFFGRSYWSIRGRECEITMEARPPY